jgi:putative transposase
MVVKIAGRRIYLWRAVDDEGEVLDVMVQKLRNKAAAMKFAARTPEKPGRVT